MLGTDAYRCVLPGSKQTSILFVYIHQFLLPVNFFGACCISIKKHGATCPSVNRHVNANAAFFFNSI